ncbi:MAG: NAD(P)H-hydrate dehydratase [Rhizobiaceae bacterium]|nr:NAD(P)H-hydrate dehydratase [Rhizobiaceae bacterium]
MDELLTPDQMNQADRLAIQAGPFDGIGLMRRAGAAVAAIVLKHYPDASVVDVLCGPGNNGGDGYVLARLLAESGLPTRVWAIGTPRTGSDAAIAMRECPMNAEPLAAFVPQPGSVVVDAIFGAGLSKTVEGDVAGAIARCAEAAVPVIAVDLPSGVSGDSGKLFGAAFRANHTVTFFRKKPGHLLYPGRELCGQTHVVDIGIKSEVLETINPSCWENTPRHWLGDFPHVAVNAHKYARGHVGVFSGGPSSTGAARLSARAAARAGAGAVTLLSPANALLVNAAHLTSIILRRTDSIEDCARWVDERKPAALVFGPAAGLDESVGEFALKLVGIATDIVRYIVFDADALTHLSGRRDAFLDAFSQTGAPHVILTPHEGEFARTFPELAADASLSKLDRARSAAVLSKATVILKGPDTVIAVPDGRSAINTNAPAWLATAGSGDVLAGITAGLLAQGMPAFEAACAAVWLHGEAGSLFGPGLIAEDLPDLLPRVLRNLMGGKPAPEAWR